ncbi:MAG: hypothetical protein LKE53_09255 [Oscillospiraceae bacterium]|jgi:hypothetical protein|nr:hypothetical protein [Oscillospiraceae bacterium]
MKCILYDSCTKDFLLPEPLSLTLQKDEDAPADSLTAAFALPQKVPGAAFCRLQDEAGVWFDGVTDTLRETVGGGRTLTLSARSRAALLLDSEALPVTYARPSLRQLFRSIAAPHGFAGIAGEQKTFYSQYEIPSGTSEWQAINGFCQSFLGVPLREENGALSAQTPAKTAPLLLGGQGTAYLQLCCTRRLYRKWSEIWGMQNGFLVQCAGDSALEKRGILRRSVSANPKSAALRAEKQALQWTVLCAGWLRAEPGQEAVLCLERGNLSLQVSQVLYRADMSSGKTTRLLLRVRTA